MDTISLRYIRARVIHQINHNPIVRPEIVSPPELIHQISHHRIRLFRFGGQWSGGESPAQRLASNRYILLDIA
jgi:hypothetical protein